MIASIALPLISSLTWARVDHAKESAARTVEGTISDPARVTLEALFGQADLVALVKVKSGDDEHYDTAVYRAEMAEAFKGGSKGDLVHFGPFISYGVGSEYLVFLGKTEQTLHDHLREAQGPYPPSSNYYRIMYEGFSILPVDYTCTIPKCDYAVEVSYEHVLLPATLAKLPSANQEDVALKAWVRKTEMVEFLKKLSIKEKLK